MDSYGLYVLLELLNVFFDWYSLAVDSWLSVITSNEENAEVVEILLNHNVDNIVVTKVTQIMKMSLYKLYIS